MSVKQKNFECEKPLEGTKLSAVEKGKLNRRNWDAYLKFLRNSKQKFPINQYGDVNLSLVAELCGFKRQVFANNKAFASELEDAVVLIGTELVEPKDPSGQMDDEIKLLKKQLSAQKRDVAILEEKNDGLSKQLMETRAELKKVKKQSLEADESLEFMIETGRRFTL